MTQHEAGSRCVIIRCWCSDFTCSYGWVRTANCLCFQNVDCQRVKLLAFKKEAPALVFGVKNSIHTCMGTTSPWSQTISPCYPFWVPKRVFPHWLLLNFNVGQFTCLPTATRRSSSPHITTAMPMDCHGFQRKLVPSILQNPVFSKSVRLRLCL